MNSPRKLNVTVLGTGRLTGLVAHRIQQRSDLTLVTPPSDGKDLPATTHCVILLPSHAALASGTVGQAIRAYLRTGVNVVSTVPAAALRDIDLLAACREGGASYHGTGGLQSRLISRFNRAFAAITRNIRAIELLEELDVEDPPAHPWSTHAEAGPDNDNPEVTPDPVVEAYYEAGLHTLADAVFGDAHADKPVVVEAERARACNALTQRRRGDEPQQDHILIRRTLGNSIAYDSIWTKRQGSPTPLRYRMKTISEDAIGHVTLSFHADSAVHPVDSLTCNGLLEAIRPTVESAPGVLHHDLEINHVMRDDRL